MLNQFTIESVDEKKLLKVLSEHKSKMNQIARRMMGKVASEIKKETKKTKLSGQILHKVSGKLMKMLAFKTFKDWSAKIMSKAFYSSWHETGNNKLPARPFLLPVVQDYFNSNKANNVADKILQDALDKLYNKEN